MYVCIYVYILYICMYMCVCVCVYIYVYILLYYEGFTLVTCTRVYIDIYRYPTLVVNNYMYIFNTYYAEALYPTVYRIAYNIYIIIFNYTYVYTHT
jgi:hypothetical protein